VRLLSGAGAGALSAAQVRYLVLEQGAGAAGFNLLLNAVIAWALFRGRATVPLWGQPGIAADTLATSFLLPFFTCLIVTPLVRRQLRGGRVPPLARPGSSRLPRATPVRALAVGALSLATGGPLALLGLGALDVSSLSFARFLVFKASFAAALAALVTPGIALAALRDAAAPARAGAGRGGAGDAASDPAALRPKFRETRHLIPLEPPSEVSK
jgi:hypothetical protein